MRRRLKMLLAATASLAVPTAAHATTPDTYFWQALCSSGAVVACGSVLIRTVQVDARNNYVQVLIRNLQGFDPRDNTAGSVFNQFFLRLPNSPLENRLSSDVPRPDQEGEVGRRGNRYGWGLADGIQYDQGFFLTMLDANDAGTPGDGIRGCEAGPQRRKFLDTRVTTIETCAAKGYTGWATLNTQINPINPPYKWNITGASFTAYGVDRNGARFQVDFPSQDVALATVTPEPATWALLGSGLALLAVVGRVRRRRAAK